MILDQRLVSRCSLSLRATGAGKCDPAQLSIRSRVRANPVWSSAVPGAFIGRHGAVLKCQRTLFASKSRAKVFRAEADNAYECGSEPSQSR
jgi:hypothetical protein